MELKRDTLLERGKFRIIETLGQGGFGITYLAEQVMAKRKVCIKEFFPKAYYKRDGNTNNISVASEGFAESMRRFKAKFIKEAQIIASLDHAHIIHIHDVFEENGTAYYVMEYIEGESLSALVKRCGALDEAIAVTYIRHIADALDYIHEQKINHLDVKPGNIMVQTKDDNAILIDFGLAKHYDDGGDQTSSTPVGISHGYAPFEQYKSGGVSSFSPATDIYSLGATLYYLVTGEVPPSATDIGKDGIKTPDNLSPGVQRAIKEAMNYWREERPQSVKEFLKLLDDDDNMVVILDVADDDTPTEKPITEPTHKLEPTPKSEPRPKAEPKPKSQPTPAPKGGGRKWLWLMLFVALIVGVATFFVLGSSSSKKENAPKSAIAMVDTPQEPNLMEPTPEEPTTGATKPVTNPVSPTKEDAKPEATKPVTNPVSPMKEPKEEANPSDGKPVTKPEFPTNEDAKPEATKPVTNPESPTNEDAKPEATKPVTQPNNEIWYTSSDGKVVKPYKEDKDIFGAVIESNTYEGGKGIIKFQGDVTTIGRYAFYGCKSLKTITIPNNVKTIGTATFWGCESLKRVTIPDSVTTIGEYAFKGCNSLKEFKGKYAADGGRCLIKDNIIFDYANASGSTYAIPNSVKKIGESAFSHCNSLTSVTIPDSVTTIGNGAFNGCESLYSVTIPDSVTTIGIGAFYGCKNLTSVTIPNSVKTIGKNAFYECNNLLEETKKKIKKINRNAL